MFGYRDPDEFLYWHHSRESHRECGARAVLCELSCRLCGDQRLTRANVLLWSSDDKCHRGNSAVDAVTVAAAYEENGWMSWPESSWRARPSESVDANRCVNRPPGCDSPGYGNADLWSPVGVDGAHHHPRCRHELLVTI